MRGVGNSEGQPGVENDFEEVLPVNLNLMIF
jgi:hypothetical protein